MRIVKGYLEELWNSAKQQPPYLQFILEKANEKGNLAFLDINVKVDTPKT